MVSSGGTNTNLFKMKKRAANTTKSQWLLWKMASCDMRKFAEKAVSCFSPFLCRHGFSELLIDYVSCITCVFLLLLFSSFCLFLSLSVSGERYCFSLRATEEIAPETVLMAYQGTLYAAGIAIFLSFLFFMVHVF